MALGIDPETGLPLALRRHRYGRYGQRGEDEDAHARRGTVPMSMEMDDIVPEVARAPLALLCTVGGHPDTGRTILAGT